MMTSVLLSLLALASGSFWELKELRATIQAPVVIWRPLNPFGLSHGITYGTECPTYANSGSTPGRGELCVDLNAGIGGIPQLQFFDGTSWTAVSAGGGVGLADANTFTGLNSFNRTAAGNDACFGATNAFCIDGDSSTLSPTAVPINLGALWDFRNDAPAAAASGDLAAVTATLNVMDGSDTVRALNIALTNADHTGATNVLDAINVGAITGDAQATETAIKVGSGWDTGLDLSAMASAVAHVKLPSTALVTANGAFAVYTNNLAAEYFATYAANEFTFQEPAAALAVVGAAQNVDPLGNITHVGAAAAADVTTVSAPPTSTGRGTWITFICNDANLTFTNTDAGAANTLDLAGSFVCSANDTLTIARDSANSRWIEVARSIN